MLLFIPRDSAQSVDTLRMERISSHSGGIFSPCFYTNSWCYNCYYFDREVCVGATVVW